MDSKILCQRCSAIAKATGEQCRNYSQCKTKVDNRWTVPLCYVHQTHIRKFGASEFYFATNAQIKTIDQKITTVDERLQRIESALFRQMVPILPMQVNPYNLPTIQSMPSTPVVQSMPNAPVVQSKPNTPDVPKTESLSNKQIQKESLYPNLENAGNVRNSNILLFQRIETFVRTVVAETELSKRLVAKTCSAEIDSDELKQFFEFSNRAEQLLADSSATLSTSQYAEKWTELENEYDKSKKQVEQLLDSQCKQKRPWSVSLDLALKWAGGKLECQGESMPSDLRAWYAAENSTDETGERVWQDKQVLCNIGASAQEKSLSAFQAKQKLANNFRVYDTIDNFVGIGKLKKKEKDDGKPDSLPNAQLQKERQDNRLKDLTKYINWIGTLDLLINLSVSLGLDPTGLQFEKQQATISLATIAVLVGEQVALQYMSKEQFQNLSTLASLASSYQSYLNSNVGVAGMANLAAYNAHQQFKGRVPEPIRKKIVRLAYANAFKTLAAIGAGGALSMLLWYNTVLWPARVIPTVGPTADSVPVMKTGSESFYTLRDIGARQTVLLTPQEQLSISNHPDSAKFLNESLEQTARTVSRNAESAKNAALTLANTQQSQLTVYYDTLYTVANQATKSQQQMVLAQSKPLTLWVDPSNSELQMSMRRYQAQLIQRMIPKQLGQAEAQRLAQQTSALGMQIDFSGSSVPVQAQLPSSVNNSSLAATQADLSAAAQSAGLSALSVLGVLLQARNNPTTVQLVTDPIRDFALQNRSLSAFANQQQSPLDNPAFFATASDFLNATNTGLQQVRRADFKLIEPSGWMQQNLPVQADSLNSAIDWADERLDGASTLFDDNQIDFGAFGRQEGVFGSAESDAQFLTLLSGSAPGGLNSTDVMQLSNFFSNLEQDVAQTSRWDLQLNSMIRQMEELNSRSATLMAQDAQMLVKAANDIQIVEKGKRAFQSRDVRDLAFSTPSSTVGFFDAITENLINPFVQDFKSIEFASLFETLKSKLPSFSSERQIGQLAEAVISATGTTDAERQSQIVSILTASRRMSKADAEQIAKQYLASSNKLSFDLLPDAIQNAQIALMQTTRFSADALFLFSKQLLVNTVQLSNIAQNVVEPLFEKLADQVGPFTKELKDLTWQEAVKVADQIKAITGGTSLTAEQRLALESLKSTAQEQIRTIEQQIELDARKWCSEISRQVQWTNATAEKKFVNRVVLASRLNAQLMADSLKPVMQNAVSDVPLTVTGKTASVMLAGAQRDYIAEMLAGWKTNAEKQLNQSKVKVVDREEKIQQQKSSLLRQAAQWDSDQQQSFKSASNLFAPASALYHQYMNASVDQVKQEFYDSTKPLQRNLATAQNISVWYRDEFSRLQRRDLTSEARVEQLQDYLASNQHMLQSLENEHKLSLDQVAQVVQCLSQGFNVQQCSILLGLPESMVNEQYNLMPFLKTKVIEKTEPRRIGTDIYRIAADVYGVDFDSVNAFYKYVVLPNLLKYPQTINTVFGTKTFTDQDLINSIRRLGMPDSHFPQLKAWIAGVPFNWNDFVKTYQTTVLMQDVDVPAMNAEPSVLDSNIVLSTKPDQPLPEANIAVTNRLQQKSAPQYEYEREIEYN